MTRAQQLAAEYMKTHNSDMPPDPSTSPAWHDRGPVPSPARREDAPSLQEGGALDEFGRPTLQVSGIPDGAGSSPEAPFEPDFLPEFSGQLSVADAVRSCPTWQSAGTDEEVNRRAIAAASNIWNLIKKSPDEALRYVRRALGHPQTGIVVYGQLPDGVKRDLEDAFLKIALRKPWLFQICRLVVILRGHVSLPHVFRACCSLGAFHAFLAYADIVGPVGNLEHIAAEAQELDPDEDAKIQALLDTAEQIQVEVDPEDEEEEFLTDTEIAALTEDELDELTDPNS